MAQQVTLAEFLEARISEDAECVHERDFWPRGTYPSRFSPRRIEIECDAKQRIVDLHSDTRPDNGPHSCATCGDQSGHGGEEEPWPCETLLALAQPHAEHPDFRPEWRV